MKCIVENIVYNNENYYVFYGVLDNKSRDEVIRGILPYTLYSGMILNVEGEYKTDSKYGKQFNITSAVEMLRAIGDNNYPDCLYHCR